MARRASRTLTGNEEERSNERPGVLLGCGHRCSRGPVARRRGRAYYICTVKSCGKMSAVDITDDHDPAG